MIRTAVAVGIRRRPFCAATATATATAASTACGLALLSSADLQSSSAALTERREAAGEASEANNSSCCIQPVPVDLNGALSSSSSIDTANAVVVVRASLAEAADVASDAAALAVPTFQASLRALNLAGTVAAMVLDYERAKLERKVYARLEVAPSVLQPLASLAGPSPEEADMIELERNADCCRRELETAQAEYTGRGDEDAAERQVDQADLREEVCRAAERLAGAEEELASRGGDRAGRVHRTAAGRLLALCRENGGVYVKVGQHLANLDYLIPEEYIEALSSLFDDAPVTPYDDVREVVRQDLGAYPDEIFDSFDVEPIASASLAQVHVARQRGTGKKLAVKVQHRGLRETSRGDIFALQTAVNVLEFLFPAEFRYGWIMEEIAPNLPKELDFKNEGRNSEAAASHIRKVGINCVVPAVHWDETTERVLTMDFEEGFRATDVAAVEEAGLKTHDVARLISSVFNSQVFQSGCIHCDPHPANVLLRERGGKPQLVLVDHGLYKRIDDDFRLAYARLWKALMTADIAQIKASCSVLGIGEMYPLLAAMLTSRPFDEIVERSKTGALEAGRGQGGPGGDASDKAMIRGYAQKFFVDILEMLDTVPRQMLLLFKMNDCLRHIDYALGSPTNTLVTAGAFAAKAVYDEERNGGSSRSVVQRMKTWLSYVQLVVKIHAYEWVSRYRQRILL